MNQLHKYIGCTSLWTLSLALMVVGTVTGSPAVVGWALLVALWACVGSAALIVDTATCRERLRMEHLATIMADAAHRSTVTRIR